MDIKTFIFLDSETTGLPLWENNKTRITELCFIAIQSNHLAMGVFPRIQNKVILCFNPCKFIESEVTTKTGLSNELLEYQPFFNNETFCLFKDFVNLQPKPVCFVAHNGNNFDYPILKSEVVKAGSELPDDLLCVDSILAFKDLHNISESTSNSSFNRVEKSDVPIELQDGFDDLLCSVVDEIEKSIQSSNKSLEEVITINETTPKKQTVNSSNSSLGPSRSNGLTTYQTNKKVPTVKRQLPFEYPSFALSEVYKRLTLKEPKNAHRAECDVDMMIECAAVLGEGFINWCNVNAKKFRDIPKMTPGKRIGQH